MECRLTRLGGAYQEKRTLLRLDPFPALDTGALDWLSSKTQNRIIRTKHAEPESLISFLRLVVKTLGANSIIKFQKVNP